MVQGTAQILVWRQEKAIRDYSYGSQRRYYPSAVTVHCEPELSIVWGE